MIPEECDESAAKLFDSFIAWLRTNGDPNVETILGTLWPRAGTLEAQLLHLNELNMLLGAVRPLPTDVVAELRNRFVVRLTYHSNAIEGNTLTQNETEMVLEHGITVAGKSLVEHLEVTGHRDAMDYMESLASTESSLGEWEIKSLHSLILHSIDRLSGANDAGKYRSVDVRAAGTNHEYPPPYRVGELMAEFSEWLNATGRDTTHPIEFASEAHYRLASIHPFRDGNGRTARLLMNLMLLRASYPIVVITNEQRSKYIDALVHAQSSGDDFAPLTKLVAEAARESFLEYLAVLATAGGSRGKGLAFYQTLSERLGF